MDLKAANAAKDIAGSLSVATRDTTNIVDAAKWYWFFTGRTFSPRFDSHGLMMAEVCIEGYK